MQNQVQVFQNEEFGKIEILMIDGKPYFPATACAKVLGYKDTINAIKQHCKGVVKHHLPTSGGNQKANFIPEGDLYRLIIRSKLPAAVRFEAWVCDEVLPGIRQRGAYITADTINRMRSDTAYAETLLKRLSAEHARNNALMDYVDKLQPKAYYCDVVLQATTSMPVSIIAKDYGMSAVAFNKLLHELGVQYKIGGTWLLYKEYANFSYTVTKTYLIGDKEVSVHTCWTQKGKCFLYALLRWYGILPSIEKVSDEAV